MGGQAQIWLKSLSPPFEYGGVQINTYKVVIKPLKMVANVKPLLLESWAGGQKYLKIDPIDKYI